MRNTKVRAGLLVASCTSILMLATAPAWAEQTVSGGHGTGLEGSDLTTSSSTNQTSKTDGEPQTEVENSTMDGSAGGVRIQAAKLLQTERENHKQALTADKKQKVCENRKDEIEKRGSNYAAAAQRHLDVFNNIFTKLQTFHDTKHLNVTNYDALVADATAKQTAATNAVQALKNADVPIDCTATDPASSVATLKVAVQNARQALKDYRSSLKNLVVALKGASTTQTNATGSN